jgi:hypothetical protein
MARCRLRGVGPVALYEQDAQMEARVEGDGLPCCVERRGCRLCDGLRRP